MLSTLAIGKDSKHELMSALAKAGQGMYNYASDGSMLGTCLLNLVTAMQCTVAEQITLRVKPLDEAVAVQLRRARVITPAQLGAATVSSVDGGLVAPKLSPNTPTDNLATLCEQRLDQALNLLERAVRAPDMEGGGAPFEDEESGGEAAEEWPPPVQDLRESCV